MSQAVLEERSRQIKTAPAGFVKDEKTGASREIRARLADGQSDQESPGKRPNGAVWPFFM